MTLINCQAISKSYGSKTLFKGLSFGIFEKDRIGLIGPNGSGKSTLLKIIAGLDYPDEGSVVTSRSLRVGYVPQETDFPDQSIEEICLTSLKRDEHLSAESKQVKIAVTLSKMGFKDISVSATSLSGGWKKRLSMALELIRDPLLLLLDEPTNHLDLEGVEWLEKFLINSPLAYVVISHDRYFLENTTNKIIELDRSYPKGIFSVDGSYSQFLTKREEFLSGQIQQERSLSSKVRREIEWLQQTPQARTTKSQSRIQEAKRLIGELGEVKSRNVSVKAKFGFDSSKRESQKLLVTNNLTMSLGGRLLFAGIDLVLTPGTRLGIVGLNGSGKTTLLRLLSGEIQPDKGTIKMIEGIKIVYFDQHRTQLPSNLSLRRALSPEGDTVRYRGQSIHVNSWCRRFIFSPDKLDLPYANLSGGEKARVHIARLMLQPADILLLDEPTNDLDISTLEILENSLQDFPGAIVLISHDRYMLDQISNSILGLGTHSDSELFADYRQWENFRDKQESKKPKLELKQKETIPQRDDKRRRMGYSEKRELEQMEEKIHLLEQEIEQIHKKINDPSLSAEEMQTLCRHLNEKQTVLDHLYHRWQELETKKDELE